MIEMLVNLEDNECRKAFIETVRENPEGIEVIRGKSVYEGRAALLGLTNQHCESLARMVIHMNDVREIQIKNRFSQLQY